MMMIGVGCCCLGQPMSGKQDSRNLLILFLKAPMHQKLHRVHVQGTCMRRCFGGEELGESGGGAGKKGEEEK